MNNADKKQGMVALIMKKIGNGKEKIAEKPEENGAEQDHEIAEESAVDEIFEAIESKDKAKFKEALESFIHLCFAKQESEPHEEFESEDENEKE